MNNYWQSYTGTILGLEELGWIGEVRTKLDDYDEKDLTDVARFPKGIVQYNFLYNMYVFKHDEIRHGDPEFVSVEVIAWLKDQDIFDSCMDAWLHGISWEDIIA